MYQLLDRVTVPELVPNVIESQIQPYCGRHKLNVDITLLNYIKVNAPVDFNMLQWDIALYRGQETKLNHLLNLHWRGR